VDLQWQKWAQQYGPIYSVILGTKTMIVLSSDEVVKDLLDKRSAIYSDRQDHYIGQTVLSGGNRFLMMHYGPTWRMIRKLCHSMFNIVKAESYVPYQDLENKQMLADLIDQPECFLNHIRRYSTSLTTQQIFGFRTTSSEDPKMIELFHNVEAFAEMIQGTGAAVLEVWPLLRWLPDFLAPDKKRAKELHKKELKMYKGHRLDAKEKRRQGALRPCFCADMAKVQEAEGFSDDLAGYTSGSMLEAGSDTTSNTLYGFVQAMLLFPDVQRKLQEEIDAVVGPDRLPQMSDYTNLPYVRCCIKETLRWMPTAISGFPHAVTQDDTYRGYRIPKGAGVMLNVYAIQMDPERYPEPRRFNPDRYENDTLSLSDSATTQDPSKRDNFVFGAGRRICQGMHVAERSLFLGVARLAWAFDITPEKDEKGRDVLPDPYVNQNLILSG